MNKNSVNLIDEKKISEIYNSMGDEYDNLKDLWYSWLFSRLHYYIAKYINKNLENRRLYCLDIGCGTGFQSYLYSLFGGTVIGVDIAENLLKIAQKKNTYMYLKQGLFESPYNFTKKYDRRILKLAKNYLYEDKFIEPKFFSASALNIPYDDNSFDIVSCCGSTISSIEDYKKALSEMSRVLKKKGKLVLETENKYNLDLFWPFIDLLFLRKLGYEQSLKESFSNLFRSRKNHIKIDFPLSLHNEEINIPIWLFSLNKLKKELKELSIDICEVKAIHNITNLIPSVLLDNPNPGRLLKIIFSVLTKFEFLFGELPFFKKIGCSIVIIGEKR